MGFLTPDTSAFTSYTDKGLYILTWRMAILSIFVFGILSLVFIRIDGTALLFYNVIFLTALAIFIYLIKTKRYKDVYWYYTSFATLLTGLSLNTRASMVHYSEFFWIISIVIYAFIGLGRKTGVIFLILNSISIGLHMYFQLNASIAVQKQLTYTEITGNFIEIVLALFSIGYLLQQHQHFQNYAEAQLKIAHNELETHYQTILKTNEENSVLAREIHHRVKNNLQIIVSLLRMHSDEVRSEETKKHFAEAISRIMSMSLIHQKLYQSRELSDIDFGEYLNELSLGILMTSGRGFDKIRLDIDCEMRGTGLKTVVPLGLLFNELLTNSLKHAFEPDEEGTITIHAKLTENQCIYICYSDSGTWKQREGGFGLELIDLLTGQLEGHYERTESNYRFTLRNLDHGDGTTG